MFSVSVLPLIGKHKSKLRKHPTPPSTRKVDVNCRRCGMPGASLHFPGGWLCDNGCDPNPIMKPIETDPEEGMDEIALRELVSTLRTQLKSVEADAEVMRGVLVKAAVLLEKNNGQHGESASWNGKEGTNRAAWMIQENDALIDEIAVITKGGKL